MDFPGKINRFAIKINVLETVVKSTASVKFNTAAQAAATSMRNSFSFRLTFTPSWYGSDGRE